MQKDTSFSPEVLKTVYNDGFIYAEDVFDRFKSFSRKVCFSLDSGNEHEDSQDEIMFL